jgi:protease II
MGQSQGREVLRVHAVVLPYDQIAAKTYPSMLVRTGLWDSQVQYWEPAKYVARLRARGTGDNLIVLRTQMEAGHGGRSVDFSVLGNGPKATPSC